LFKKACYALVCILAFSCIWAGEDKGSTTDSNTKEEEESFLNVEAVHERNNERVLGPKNTSAVALNPVLFPLPEKKFVLEGDVLYGRQFNYGRYWKSSQRWSAIAADKAAFYDEFSKHKRSLLKVTENAVDKGRFHRAYTRGVYKNNAENFRVVVGDATTHNTIGFQQTLSGAGVSIFRQDGDGDVINGSSPIVITVLSKVECRLNGEVIAARILGPGLYSIDDLPEEAKLPGVSVKISDQFGRSEILKMDFNGSYRMLAAGLNDWDVTVVCPSKYDLEDPARLKYKGKPRFSANYRQGYTDDVMVGVGGQVYGSSFIIDSAVIFAGKFGKISPNLAYSDAKRKGKNTKRAAGIGLFYAIPENEYGLFMETLLGFKGKGFGDLDKSADAESVYNAFIDKHFSSENTKAKFRNSGKESSTKQITVRLYSKPIVGITPAFVFYGTWGDSEDRSKHSKLREYTLSFTREVFHDCVAVMAIGLTYDDPSKGRNQRSPDRRLSVAFTWRINQEFSNNGSYKCYDEDRRRCNGQIVYTPQNVPGLELSSEMVRRPGLSQPSFSCKYKAPYFHVKAEEFITSTYEDKEANTINSHTNRQRFVFGTSLSETKIKSNRKSGFNTLR
jgi:outer membrane usher protein FimD/PapC